MRISRRHGTAAGAREGQRGQALLELALVTPILVLLIMAIFQFAYVLQAQMGLTNAVREAARRAAAATATDASALETWTKTQQLAGGVNLLASNVPYYNSTRLAGTTAQVCAYTAPGSGGTLSGQMITVSATYKYPVFFPLIAFALPGNDGTNWQLSASAQMRLENPFTPAPGLACT